jgi:hypothetical protein
MSGIVRKRAGGGALTDVVSIRLSPDDRHLLDSVSALVPVIPRLTLARVALRIGLQVIRQNPAQALAPQPRRVSR